MFYLYFIFLSLSSTGRFRDHHEKDRFPGFAQGDHGIPARSTGGSFPLFHISVPSFPFLLFSFSFPPYPVISPQLSIHVPIPPIRTLKSGISSWKAFVQKVSRRFERVARIDRNWREGAALTQIIRWDHATTLTPVFRLIN